MKALLALIQKLYGKSAITKTIGTRTNVIKLPNNETKRYIKEELNIEAASDRLAKKAYEDIKELIADIPKMNDQEILTLKGNLQRLDNKLNPPIAEVTEFGTRQKISPEGIKTLIQEKGQVARPGTLMGNLESRIKQLEASGEDLSKMKGQTLDELMGDFSAGQQGMRQLEKEGLVRATARDIITSDIKSGKLKLPKEVQQQILEGGGEPIDVLRNVYGEDALEVLDSLIPEFSKLKTSTEAEKLARSKFKFEPDVNRPKGSMTPEEAAKAEQENILKPKKPGEPEEFAIGGRVGMMVGGILRAKKILDASKKLKKGKTKKIKGEVLEDGTPDYEYYSEILDDAENQFVKGNETLEQLEKMVKEKKDFMGYMYQQYKMGKLDPKPGEVNRSRLNFLKNKLDEAEMSGDKRLITEDEIYELNDLEKRFRKIDLEEKVQDLNKKITGDEITELKDLTDTGYAIGGRVGYSDGTKPSAAENTPSQEIINRMIAQIKHMSKMGADVDTIKSVVGASDQMIKDVLGKQSGGLAYLMGM